MSKCKCNKCKCVTASLYQRKEGISKDVYAVQKKVIGGNRLICLTPASSEKEAIRIAKKNRLI